MNATPPAGADMRVDYTTPQAVARHLAVSVKLVYRLAAAGELEAVKIGRSVRILIASVQEFIARNTMSRGVKECYARKSEPMPTPQLSPRSRKKPDPAGFVFLPPP